MLNIFKKKKSEEVAVGSGIVVKLPVCKSTFKKDKIVREYGEREFTLDMSLNAQRKFESNFPHLAKNDDLVSYTERIKKHMSENQLTLASIYSFIKCIYCYFDDKQISFETFSSMFDTMNPEYVQKLIKELTFMFDIIINSASEKN